MASALVAAAASLLLPVIAARALNAVLVAHDVGAALTTMLVVLTLRIIAEALGSVARAYATTRVTGALRYQILRQVFTLGVAGQRQYNTGDLVARITGNVARSATIAPTLVHAAVAIAASLGGLIGLVLIDWPIGIVFLTAAVPAVVVLRLLTNQLTSSYAEYLGHVSAIAARLTDALAGSRTISASGTLRREVDRVLVPLPDLARSGSRIWAVQRSASWQFALIVSTVRVLVLGTAGVALAAGQITAGEMLAASLYLSQALGLLQHLDSLTTLGEARANALRVLHVLADDPPTEPAHGPAPDTGDIEPGTGLITFRRIVVRRQGRTILDGVDLQIPAGTAMALVGRSGMGKTSLAMLPGRLLDPESGETLIDGVCVNTLDTAHLRRQVSYAFSRPVLLGRTVHDALTYGRPGAPEAEVEAALRVARADDFIRRLPNGLETSLAACPFSGGEMQRLGLARAIIHGGRIMILDDATSSLDTVTEAEIAEALTAGPANRTRILVAHRAHTAARADLVAWLDNGRIRAVGTHHDLWVREPEYRAIFAAPQLADWDDR
jgi:ATP-binding cassette subfamily B protein